MKITQSTDYALRVLLYLGLKKQLATVAEISQAFNVSHHHLVKVVHRLTAEGYVRSYKGKGGGIELALSPDEIRIGDFVRSREPMELLECFNHHTNICPIQGVCSLERALYEAREAFIASLNRLTLANFLKSGQEIVERKRRLKIV